MDLIPTIVVFFVCVFRKMGKATRRHQPTQMLSQERVESICLSVWMFHYADLINTAFSSRRVVELEFPREYCIAALFMATESASKNLKFAKFSSPIREISVIVCGGSVFLLSFFFLFFWFIYLFRIVGNASTARY